MMKIIITGNVLNSKINNFALEKIDFEDDEKILNDCQKKAVLSGVNNRITLIQGAPGTGKTSTII